MIRETVRTSVKPRRCVGACRSHIPVGARYCEVVLSPGHDLGPSGWSRCAYCLPCAGITEPTDREVRPAEVEGEATEAAASPTQAT